MPLFQLASSSVLENFFSFNIFAAGVQSSIIKNNAIFETHLPDLDYYRCFSSICVQLNLYLTGFCVIAIVIHKFLAAAGTRESWLTEKQEGV